MPFTSTTILKVVKHVGEWSAFILSFIVHTILRQWLDENCYQYHVPPSVICDVMEFETIIFFRWFEELYVFDINVHELLSLLRPLTIPILTLFVSKQLAWIRWRWGTSGWREKGMTQRAIICDQWAWQISKVWFSSRTHKQWGEQGRERKGGKRGRGGRGSQPLMAPV